MASNDPWTSVTNANYYVLDGVPMRISENFRPTTSQREALPPLRFNLGQSNAIKFKYDFKHENGYMEYYKAFQEEKGRVEAQQESKKAQKEAERLAKALKMQEENAKKLQPATIPDGARKEPAVVPTVSSSILLPQRANPTTVTSDNSQPAVATVNLRDFENLAEDPFDTMELKTINDMKELESVLANSPRPHPQTEQTVSTPDHQILSSTAGHATNGFEENIYENPSTISGMENGDIYGNVHQSVPLRQDNVNITRAKKGPVASPRESLTISSSTHSENNLNASDGLASAQFNCRTGEVTVGSTSQPEVKDKTTINIPVALKPPPPVKPKPTVGGNAANKAESSAAPVTTTSTKNPKVQSLAKAIANDLENVVSRPPGAPKGFSYVGPVKNEPSGKDVKDIEWPDFDQKSLPSTPNPSDGGLASESTEQAPSFAPSSNKKPQNSKQKHTPKPDYSYSHSVSMAQKAKITAATDEKKKSNRVRPPPPRPTSQPNLKSRPAKPSSDKEAIDSLLSMGFDRDQITDAIKYIGPNTKRLVEHLCAVQQLVSKGIQWQSAQHALVTCGPDLEKAEKFAKAYTQLSEFGFGDAKIKEVLISCDMDVQKSLDQLVS